MFRLKLYWNDIGDATNTLTLTTESVPTREQANDLLERFQASLGKQLTGASIEQSVPGIGWVVGPG